MKFLKCIVVLVLFLSVVSCKETVDIYLGIPLQPKLEESNYVPGLNIIGILRPDFNDSISNSFVHVQEIAPAIDNYPEFSIDSLLVEDATVNVFGTDGEPYAFTYTDYNNLFDAEQYRPSKDFEVKAGSTYEISCMYQELPELTSLTTIPYKPVLIEESIDLNNKLLKFNVAIDTSAFMYEVYALKNEAYIGFFRVIPTHSEVTSIEVNLSSNNPDLIVIYAYDFNLATYNATSNTSLNFNKYRKTYGNVEGGYGVFGSMNYSEHRFN